MSPEDIEKMTIENAKAIGELAVIATRTSEDMDRMIKNQQDMMPLNTRVTSLEKRTKNNEEAIDSMWSGSLTKWIITLLLAFNTYTYVTTQSATKENLKKINELDATFEKHKISDAKDKEADVLKKEALESAINKQVEHQGRNHERIESNKSRIDNLERKPPVLTQSYSITKE